MEQKTQQQLLVGQMFDFASRVLSLCYNRFYISSAVGIFYSTIQQTLLDDFYNIERLLAEVMLAKGQESISHVLEASTISATITFGSTEHEEVLQSREIFLDLFHLLNSLSMTLHNEVFSGKYSEFLKKCIEARDVPRQAHVHGT